MCFDVQDNKYYHHIRLARLVAASQTGSRSDSMMGIAIFGSCVVCLLGKEMFVLARLQLTQKREALFLRNKMVICVFSHSVAHNCIECTGYKNEHY